LKQSLPSKASELAEEICAFANAAGGTLLIGVSDKGQIVGVKTDNTIRPLNFEKLLESYWEPFINTSQHNIHSKFTATIKSQNANWQ
jgi:predicted HTH transcriptional regulator